MPFRETVAAFLCELQEACWLHVCRT